MQKCNISKKREKKYIVVGGGTAGHVYPAQALAAKLLEPDDQNHDVEVDLITDQRGLKYAKGFSNIHVYCVRSNKALLIFDIIKNIPKIFKLISSKRHEAIILFGGYVSLLPAIIAFFKRIPVYVVETNAKEGKTHKICKRFATKAFSTFPLFNHIQVGFIAREQFETKSKTAKAIKTILVTGSSIGAHFFSHKLPEALVKLGEKHCLHIIQHSPAQYHQALSLQYASAGITCELSTFFTDIHIKMQEADFIITRAGGSTLAEIAALKKPCLLVPWKFAANNHQLENARSCGASYVEEDDFSANNLIKLIEQAFNDLSKISPHIPVDGALRIKKEISDSASS